MQKTNRSTMKSLYANSVKELTVTKYLVFCGLMAALAIVLNYTTSIYITSYIKIGFSGLPNRIVDYMFGPFIGAFFGAAMDILKFVTKPSGGAFFPGYTLSAVVGSLIYGFILYKKPISIKRIVLAELLVKAIVNCGLNTYWAYMMTGKAFMVILTAKLIKNGVSVIVDSIILFILLTAIRKISNKSGFKILE